MNRELHKKKKEKKETEKKINNNFKKLRGKMELRGRDWGKGLRIYKYLLK